MKTSPKIIAFSLSAALVALLPGTTGAQTIDRATQVRIDRVLKATPLIDGHNDLP